MIPQTYKRLHIIIRLFILSFVILVVVFVAIVAIQQIDWKILSDALPKYSIVWVIILIGSGIGCGVVLMWLFYMPDMWTIVRLMNSPGIVEHFITLVHVKVDNLGWKKYLSTKIDFKE